MSATALGASRTDICVNAHADPGRCPLSGGRRLADNRPMTRPRCEIVDRVNGGVYHLGARCVRRAMLCGTDPLTGLDFSHRRAWIEQRLLFLTRVFTVHVQTYAVMSNHYHITVHYTPKDRLELDDHDVARRWLTVFPPQNPDLLDDAVAKLLDDPDRLAVLRDRLGDLSWYMRCLNEPIARRANLEDGCTGRFWQGRFRSKDTPDELAAWAAMAYDDLNPVRAGMTDQLDAPEHTSLQRRLEEAEEEPERLDQPMAPLTVDDGKVVSAPPPAPRLDMTLREYVAHVEWTAGRLHDTPARNERAPPERLGDPASWLRLVAGCRQRSPAATLPRWVRASA